MNIRDQRFNHNTVRCTYVTNTTCFCQCWGKYTLAKGCLRAYSPWSSRVTPPRPTAATERSPLGMYKGTVTRNLEVTEADTEGQLSIESDTCTYTAPWYTVALLLGYFSEGGGLLGLLHRYLHIYFLGPIVRYLCVKNY